MNFRTGATRSLAQLKGYFDSWAATQAYEVFPASCPASRCTMSCRRWPLPEIEAPLKQASQQTFCCRAPILWRVFPTRVRLLPSLSEDATSPDSFQRGHCNRKRMNSTVTAWPATRDSHAPRNRRTTRLRQERT
jgi:hypothetical protein